MAGKKDHKNIAKTPISLFNVCFIQIIKNKNPLVAYLKTEHRKRLFKGFTYVETLKIGY